MQTIIRASQRAVRCIEENPDRAVQIVARGTGLPEPIVQPAMQRHVYRLGLGEPIRQSLHNTALFLRERQLIQQLPDWDQACDNRFLP
jgi:ABC-type nitrate/sulfonate/bicarbonate transport system substrate-binding protein